MADSSTFQVVKRKGGKRTGRTVAKVADNRLSGVDEEDSFDVSSFQKRLRNYMQELRLTELLQDCAEYLTSEIDHQEELPEYRSVPDKESVKCHSSNSKLCPDLLSYGIGHFSSCPIARYQLAFLLVLREKLNSSSCHVYDPVFSSREKDALEDLGCTVISLNEEGKRVCSTPTVLFMPHCGKALYNNVIWTNLDTLNCLTIIGNSFSRMMESTPHRLLMQTAKYVIKVSPYTEERPLKLSSFAHSDVFNDLAVHTFPRSKLRAAPSEFWEDNTEPVYEEDKVEIIQKEDCEKGAS